MNTLSRRSLRAAGSAIRYGDRPAVLNGSRKAKCSTWFAWGLLSVSAFLGATHAASALHAAISGSVAEFHPGLGTYHYEVQWRGGLPLAKASLRVDREDDWYRITLRARTRGLVDKVYRLRYLGEGTITADEWAPVESVIEHKARNREKTTRIAFLPDGTIRSVEVRTRKGKTRTKVRESRGPPFTLDPFSTVLMARSVDWEVGESEQFAVHDGKHRYEIHLNCQGLAPVPTGDRRRDAWVITPSPLQGSRRLTTPGRFPSAKSWTGMSRPFGPKTRVELTPIRGQGAHGAGRGRFCMG